MTTLAWTLCSLFLLAAIHPFTTYPLSLLVIQRWRPTRAAGARGPESPADLAICCCAYNEEAVIEEKISNLMMLKELMPTLEILVYVDAATDRTAELVRRHDDWIVLHVSAERRGKTHGMNLLVGMATAPIVVFTDATVTIEPMALVNLQRYFADPEIGCVCGQLTYVNAGESATAAVGSLYWRLEEWIKQMESDTGAVIGADGSIFAIRRRLHHQIPDHLIDDMCLSLSILCDGYRIVWAPDVRATEKTIPSSLGEFRRKIRIGCQSFNVHRLLWGRIRRLDGLSRYKYVSHKLLRWLAIYSLGFSFICLEFALAMASRAELGLGVAAAIVLILYIGAISRINPLAQIWEILVAFVGTGIGVWQSLRGRYYATWTPSPSIRG
jgi:cellulose synthase/poly-beta-1,6-N-acetylglucosamine synthase-like glycosyltransferase